jgi:hypothetical protein
MPRSYIATLAALLCSAFVLSPCFAQPKQNAQTLNRDEESIRKLLQSRDHDTTTQYVAAFRDLNGDGKPEAIVYLIGKSWCGSGGCNLFILQKAGASWKIVTRMTVTNPPIRMLNTTSNGWRSLAVWVHGGGYEAELRFNGKTYPRNPSVPPARRAANNLAGEVLISSSTNPKPLW